MVDNECGHIQFVLTNDMVTTKQRHGYYQKHSKQRHGYYQFRHLF